jgi:hypothetical protein
MLPRACAAARQAKAVLGLVSSSLHESNGNHPQPTHGRKLPGVVSV